MHIYIDSCTDTGADPDIDAGTDPDIDTHRITCTYMCTEIISGPYTDT